ncbi:MAG: aldo/keto reductase [Oligoflexia bacterium]|nr:aldo/keto reductase [Oligoflexia bacterium]
MPHRMLGRTGLQVSVFSYGFWATFGVKQGLTKDEGIERAKDCLRTARQAGVNLFDNAEVYGNPRGQAEHIMGQALAQLVAEDPTLWRRSDILVTTKIFWGGDGVNEKGLSRKHIIEGMEASLDRLQLDYVDLAFCHRPDPFTPTETVVRAMSDVVRGGLATAWGTSEWSAQQITEACWIARTMGLEPPQFEQPQYNMFHRQRVEQEYHPIYRQPYGFGTTVWSPLMSGILTGKYNDAIPDGSRLTQPGYEWLCKALQQHRDTGVIDKVRALSTYARDTLDCSMAQLALAWAVKNPHVSTVLLGATRPEQITENLGAIAVARRLDDVQMAAIEQILANKPDIYSGYGGAGMRSLDTL